MGQVEKLALSISYIGAGGAWDAEVEEVRRAGQGLALTILHHIPEGPDRTTAVNRTREAIMYAYQALAVRQE